MSVRRSFRLILSAGVFCLALFPAPAQQTGVPVLTRQQFYPFDETDFLRSTVDLGRIKRSYFVGEPVAVPLVLSNHTRFPVTIETNFVPVSQLQVYIQPENDREERYPGAHLPELYGTVEIPLRPLASSTTQVHLWADRESSVGLAFEAPGEYRIRIVQTASVKEGGAALRNIQLNYPEFTLRIRETPDELKPLIERLKQIKGFISMQLGRLPPEMSIEEAEEIVRTAPASPLTAYLYNCLGARYQLEFIDDPSRRDLADKALFYYQSASLSDSPIQIEILLNLLRFFDRLDVPQGAADTARRLVETMPSNQRKNLGSHSLVQKYLALYDDIEPMTFWTLLP